MESIWLPRQRTTLAEWGKGLCKEIAVVLSPLVSFACRLLPPSFSPGQERQGQLCPMRTPLSSHLLSVCRWGGLALCTALGMQRAVRPDSARLSGLESDLGSHVILATRLCDLKQAPLCLTFLSIK